MWRALALLAILCLTAAGCGSESTPTTVDGPAQPIEPGGEGFTVSTDAFADDEPIPERFTCDGEDISPRIVLTGVPDTSVELALIVDDPDAGGFVHWVLAGIPATARELPEGTALGQYISGENGFGRSGYGGPCPPPGDGAHQYDFMLYALDEEIDVEPGVTAEGLEAAMEGAILGTAVLSGTYARQ
jgi:Raf kinase inhibitor-like YbhB/YbcL family protein